MLLAAAGAFSPLLLWSCLAFGQDSRASGPSPTSTAPASEPGTPRIEESPLVIKYVRDKNGDLVPLLNMTWEDARKALDILHGIAQRNQPPGYSIQRVSATGKAEGKHAELTVVVEVLPRRNDWVRVPLRLDGAILREPAQYGGGGEGFVELEPDGEGYVGWIRGEVDKTHLLTLKLLVPLGGVADEPQLRLLTPRAAVSELTVEVPMADAVGKVSEPAVLEPPARRNGKTAFTVRGRGGDLELTWHKADGMPTETPLVLEAEASILVRIDSRSIDTEATLSVRGFGSPFDRFLVDLPPGTQRVKENSSGYTVTEVATENDRVEVRLEEKTNGPVEIRILTTRPYNPADRSEWFEVLGFEVVGAARQSGQVALAAVGQWEVQWRGTQGIRQIEIDQLVDTLRHEDVVAGFEFFAPEASLSAQRVPRVSRISVEPTYVLMIGPEEVRLEATLPYTVRGAKASELVCLLPGWKLDTVGPSNLVDVDRVKLIDAELYAIPLLEPSAGRMELRLVAHLPIAAGTKTLAVALPQPQADSPGPATVVVVPADNVELIPNPNMSGLTRQQIAPRITLPDRQQDPLFYRAGEAKAKFEAGFRVLPQSISARVSSQLDLEAGSVEQKLIYTIRHVPTDYFIVEVPRSLAEPDTLEFLYEERTLPVVPVPGEEDPQDASQPVRRLISLPEAMIGPCKLTVRYSMPSAPAVSGRTSVPLIMPLAEHFSASELYVRFSAGIRVEPPGSPWTVSQNSLPGVEPSSGLHLIAEERTGAVELAIEPAERDAEGTETTVVERAWVRTWLTHDARQDRAVFSFASDRAELAVILPAGAAVDQTQVLLNDKLVSPKEINDHRLLVPLFTDGELHRYRLELRTHFLRARQPAGRLSLEIPRLGDGVWVRHMYWQLVLPKDEHVVTVPEGFTHEFAWRWNDYCWSRKPLLGHEELEDWVGAPHEANVPTEVNCYLFSSMGQVEVCRLRTATRTWIVLLAASAVLGAGLLLIYFPKSRHPATLLCAGVVLLGVGVVHPEPTLLLSQAAGLGLALALVAGLLQRSVGRRRRGTMLVEPPSSVLEHGSTQARYELPAAGDQASTVTAPAVPPPADPGADS